MGDIQKVIHNMFQKHPNLLVFEDEKLIPYVARELNIVPNNYQKQKLLNAIKRYRILSIIQSNQPIIQLDSPYESL
jgi:hypothetical protein